MKGRREKSIFSGSRFQWGEGWHKERVNEGVYGGCVFVSIYENRRMKPLEIVIKRGGRRERGRMMEGVNPTKIYYKCICKYHNVSPCITIICNKIINKEEY
jgi:hypothetical protein